MPPKGKRPGSGEGGSKSTKRGKASDDADFVEVGNSSSEMISDSQPKETVAPVAQMQAGPSGTPACFPRPLNLTSIRYNNYAWDEAIGKWKCLRCTHKLTYIAHQTGTKSLIRHDNTHGTAASATKSIQLTFEQLADLNRPMTQEQHDKMLLDFIIETNANFQIVKKPSFRRGWLAGKRNVKLPGVKKLKTLMDRRFVMEKQKLANVLKDHKGKMSLILDAWRSGNFLNFIGIIAVFVQDWKIKMVVLDFAILKGQHSGRRIAEIVWKVLEDFDIVTKVATVTTDNASNMDTMMSALEQKFQNCNGTLTKAKNHIRCVAHIINLAVQRALNVIKDPTVVLLENPTFLSRVVDEIGEELETDTDEGRDSEAETDSKAETDSEAGSSDVEMFADEIDEDVFEEDETPGSQVTENEALYKRLRKFIVKVRLSSEKREMLQKYCKTENCKAKELILDSHIRWNSTYDMLSRAYELRWAVNSMASRFDDLKSLDIIDQEWELVHNLIEFLKPFKIATLTISQQSFPLLSDALTAYMYLYNEGEKLLDGVVSPIVLEAWRRAKDVLDKYLPQTASDVQRAALLLDPRTKLGWYDKAGLPGEKATSKRVLQNYWKDYKAEQQTTQPSKDTATHVPVPPTKSLDLVEAFMDTDETPKDELQVYLSETRVKLNLESDANAVLNRWKSNSTKFPNLSKMACDFLCAWPTSVPIENKFSGGQDILTKRRMKLGHERLRRLLCLKYWTR